MSGKGDTRRPEAKPGSYHIGWERTFGAPFVEVYEGGHHHVVCNSIEHRVMYGGSTNPQLKKEHRQMRSRPPFPCDCARYR